MAKVQSTNQQKRSCVLPPLRCTEDERAAIQANAALAGLTLSQYMREAALEGHVIVKDPLADIALIRELKALGNNLNQLTRKAHIHDELSARQLREVLGRVSSVLDRLLA